MVIDTQTLDRNIKNYISDIKPTIPIDKVYLFGSYAKGTPHEWSDVDLCFFSNYFAGKSSIDITTKLLNIALKYNPDICFEPHVFPTSELENDNPFVKEVLRTGKEILVGDD
jgi:predicted nucleotidyltransferase